MPRYHFVVRVYDHTHGDPEGVDLPNHEAATEHGHRIVRELREDGYQNAALVVHDETGQLIHSITS